MAPTEFSWWGTHWIFQSILLAPTESSWSSIQITQDIRLFVIHPCGPTDIWLIVSNCAHASLTTAEALIQSIHSCIIRPTARRPDLVLWVTDFRFVATETAALLISFVTIFSDCDIFLPSETDTISFEIFGASAGAVSVFAIAALPCRLQWILCTCLWLEADCEIRLWLFHTFLSWWNRI